MMKKLTRDPLFHITYLSVVPSFPFLPQRNRIWRLNRTQIRTSMERDPSTLIYELRSAVMDHLNLANSRLEIERKTVLEMVNQTRDEMRKKDSHNRTLIEDLLQRIQRLEEKWIMVIDMTWPLDMTWPSDRIWPQNDMTFQYDMTPDMTWPLIMTLPLNKTCPLQMTWLQYMTWSLHMTWCYLTWHGNKTNYSDKPDRMTKWQLLQNWLLIAL